MTPPEITVRPFGRDEENVLLEFYRHHLEAGDRVATLYHWRGHDSASGGSRPVGAWSGDELLGTVNVVPLGLLGYGNHWRACWQQDSIVSAAARGKGVGRALVMSALGNWPVVLAKGTSEAMYALRKSAGFIDVPDDTYLLKVLRPFARNGGLKRRLLTPAVYLRGLLAYVRRHRSRLECRLLDSFGPFYDGLAARLKDRPYLTPFKPASYLNWRYRTCPVRTYEIVEALSGAGPVGAVVLRLPVPQDPDAWLVDVLADPGDDDVMATLLWAAIDTARSLRVPVLRAFASSPSVRVSLRRAGFMNTRSTPHFTFLPGSSGRDIPDAAAWNFWHGDGDVELYP